MTPTKAYLLLGGSGSSDAGKPDSWEHDFIAGMRSRRKVDFDIVGLRTHPGPDASTIENLVGPQPRVTLRSAPGTGSRLWPLLRAIRDHRAKFDDSAPDVVIAVGSLSELLAIILTPKLRKAKRILWLGAADRPSIERQAQSRLGRLTRSVQAEMYKTTDALVSDSQAVVAALQQQGISATLMTGGSGSEMDQFDLIVSNVLGTNGCPNCEQLRTKNEVLKAMLQEEIHANLVDEIAMMQGLKRPAKPVI